MEDVWIGRRSITGETEPGTWTRVNSSACGKRSHRTSSAFSPPRMPVSQSCTSAIRGSDILSGAHFAIDRPDTAHRLLPRELTGARDPLVHHVAPQPFVGQHPIDGVG